MTSRGSVRYAITGTAPTSSTATKTASGALPIEPREREHESGEVENEQSGQDEGAQDGARPGTERRQYERHDQTEERAQRKEIATGDERVVADDQRAVGRDVQQHDHRNRDRGHGDDLRPTR